jgi:hypothetical protein
MVLKAQHGRQRDATPEPEPSAAQGSSDPLESVTAPCRVIEESSQPKTIEVPKVRDARKGDAQRFHPGRAGAAAPDAGSGEPGSDEPRPEVLEAAWAADDETLAGSPCTQSGALRIRGDGYGPGPPDRSGRGSDRAVQIAGVGQAAGRDTIA